LYHYRIIFFKRRLKKSIKYIGELLKKKLSCIKLKNKYLSDGIFVFPLEGLLNLNDSSFNNTFKK